MWKSLNLNQVIWQKLKMVKPGNVQWNLCRRTNWENRSDCRSVHDIYKWLYFANGKPRRFCKDTYCFVFFLSGTEDCSSKNVTVETGTSSNDNSSVNSTSGNKTYGGGISSREVSLSDSTISDQNNVTRKFGMWLRCESSGWFVLLYCVSILSLNSSPECKEHAGAWIQLLYWSWEWAKETYRHSWLGVRFNTVIIAWPWNSFIAVRLGLPSVLIMAF